MTDDDAGNGKQLVGHSSITSDGRSRRGCRCEGPSAAGWEVLVRACVCTLPWIEERTSACVRACACGSQRGQLSCSRLRRHRRELTSRLPRR